jgi:hypothetical protein
MAFFNPGLNLSFDGVKLSTCTTALPAIMRSWLGQLLPNRIDTRLHDAEPVRAWAPAKARQ